MNKFILLFFSILLWSCTCVDFGFTNECKSFITSYGRHSDSSYIKWKIRILGQRLNINGITKGTDSIELRIWFPGIFNLDSTRHLIIFKLNICNSWEITHVKFRFVYYGGLEFFDGDLEKKVIKLNVATSKVKSLSSHMTMLINDYTPMDSSNCIDFSEEPERHPLFIEYATPCSYWATAFWRPNQFKNKVCMTISDSQLVDLLDHISKLKGLEFVNNYVR